MKVPADPLYQHLIVTAERKFCCVENGEPTARFGVEPPKPHQGRADRRYEFVQCPGRSLLRYSRASARPTSSTNRPRPSSRAWCRRTPQQAIGHGARHQRHRDPASDGCGGPAPGAPLPNLRPAALGCPSPAILGDEAAWWREAGIDPTAPARALLVGNASAAKSPRRHHRRAVMEPSGKASAAATLSRSGVSEAIASRDGKILRMLMGRRNLHCSALTDFVLVRPRRWVVVCQVSLRIKPWSLPKSNVPFFTFSSTGLRFLETARGQFSTTLTLTAP